MGKWPGKTRNLFDSWLYAEFNLAFEQHPFSLITKPADGERWVDRLTTCFQQIPVPARKFPGKKVARQKTLYINELMFVQIYWKQS
jgi:hypothetical protein